MQSGVDAKKIKSTVKAEAKGWINDLCTNYLQVKWQVMYDEVSLVKIQTTESVNVIKFLLLNSQNIHLAHVAPMSFNFEPASNLNLNLVQL